MDLVQFFQDLADKYAADKKCGLCWSFGAPLSESGLNKQEITQENVCCVQMFLTDYSIGSEYRYSQRTELLNFERCLHNFTLYVVQQVDDTGISTYNEITGHPISQSLWQTVYKPILDCLGCGKELYLCELGYDFDIIKWALKKVHLRGDRNLTGWKIDGTFRTKK